MKNITNFILESRAKKRDTSDIKEWIEDVSKQGNTLSDEQLEELLIMVREYFIPIKYDELNLGFSDKDLICDIAGYIIEAAAYDAFKSTGRNVTTRAGRGLKINGENVYWDFSIKGLNEKFEIKSRCKNGYHTGGISPTKDQKSDNDLIYIIIPYVVTEVGFDVDIENIKVQRGYKIKK